MTIRHIDYVAIEDAPLGHPGYSYESHVEIETLVAQYVDLPEPFATALHEVIDHPDDQVCARCDDPTGYLLYDDEPQRSGLRWHAVWLAREDDGPVVVLCEDCSPWIPVKVLS